jgi:glycerophosphoryl diester phosphodiesterase
VVPLIIAHRGASGYRPEHTLEAYALAIEQGADYIEPDLVITRDGVLVARHENEIGSTTDVAEKFPARRAVKTIDGRQVEGWFTEDFTLAELRTLRARERLAFRSKAYDGQFLVPTFDEVITLAQRKSAEAGRTIGIYPETKHPSHFRGLGLPLEEPLLAALRRHGWDRADAPVFIQSFEVGNLQALSRQTEVPLVQLIEFEGAPWDFIAADDPRRYADLVTPAGLADIARYADGIGPDKRLVLPVGPEGRSGAPTTLVRDAHAAGLVVHAWTFRSEDRYLAAEFQGDPAAEIRRFLELGLDGLFSDFPDVAVAARGRR